MTMTMQNTMTRPMAPFSTSDVFETRAPGAADFRSVGHREAGAALDADANWTPRLAVASALACGLLALAALSMVDKLTAAALAAAF